MEHFLKLIVVLSLFYCCNAQVNTATCAKDGEYCQSSAQCCSKSCLGFSYKCVAVHPSVFNEGHIGVVPVTAATGGTDLGSRVDVDPAVPSTPARQCANEGEFCHTGSECCSGSCLGFAHRCARGNGIIRPAQPLSQTPVLSVPIPVASAPASTVAPDLSLNNRFDETTNTTTIIDSRFCAKDGDYCQSNAECCSRSCLSLSYKCVPNTQISNANLSPQASTPISSTANLVNRFDETPAGKVCAKDGETCQTSAECCSKSCLRFSRKCVKSNQLYFADQPDVPPQQVQQPLPTPSTGHLPALIQLLTPTTTRRTPAADLVNRFDEANNNTCVADGGYCQLSSQCCSKSCLSFSYKCVPSYQIPAAEANQGVSIVDRFDEDSGNCAKDGEYCQTHNECCSLSCLSFSYKCVPSHQRPSANAPGGSFTNTTSQMSLDELVNRFGGGEFEDTVVASTSAPAATPSVSTTTRQNCRGLGSQCLQNSECCTGRCPGYLHQCVT